MGKTTIVIASAAAEASKRWSHRLRETFAICEVAELRALEQVTANLKPRILVLDLTLPGLGRVRGLRHIQGLSPTTKTLVLADNPNDGEGICALKAGAKGYYTRTIDPAHLKKAVEAVQKGEIWIRRKLIPELVAGLISLTETRQKASKESNGELDRRLQSLTIRQRGVAELIARGASNKEIASQLNVCERTVKAHLTEMFRNIGVSDRLQLALLLSKGSFGIPGVRLGGSGTQPAGPVPNDGHPIPRQPAGAARALAAE
jgi:two-component system, NarL family, nitrate/nitrite response regulator NarL